MLRFELIEALTYRKLVAELNVVCQEQPGLRPHGPPIEHAGRVMQIMVRDVDLEAPAERPYVRAYADSLTDEEPLTAKVDRLLRDGYVLWGEPGHDEFAEWQTLVAPSAIGGGT